MDATMTEVLAAGTLTRPDRQPDLAPQGGTSL